MRALIAFILFLVAPALLAEEKFRPAPFDIAKREYQEGKLNEALATIQTAAQKEELSAWLLDLKGQILLEQGKADEAIELFNASHAKDPIVHGSIHVGDALLRQKKFAAARDAYLAASKETNILLNNERLRMGVLMSYLGEKNEAEAAEALAGIPFPTEGPAYYFAQAAWAFAHGKPGEGKKWIQRSHEIFSEQATATVARPLYEFGWLKTKPPLVAD